jgi:hypothetical protein
MIQLEHCRYSYPDQSEVRLLVGDIFQVALWYRQQGKMKVLVNIPRNNLSTTDIFY